MIFAHFQTKRDFVRRPKPFIGGEGTQGVVGGGGLFGPSSIYSMLKEALVCYLGQFVLYSALILKHELAAA